MLDFYDDIVAGFNDSSKIDEVLTDKKETGPKTRIKCLMTRDIYYVLPSFTTIPHFASSSNLEN